MEAAWWSSSSGMVQQLSSHGHGAAVLAQAKPGNAAAAWGGQGTGSMAGAFPCLVAKLPLALSSSMTFVRAPGNWAGMAHWMLTGHLCPWLCQCQFKLGRDLP